MVSLSNHEERSRSKQSLSCAGLDPGIQSCRTRYRISATLDRRIKSGDDKLGGLVALSCKSCVSRPIALVHRCDRCTAEPRHPGMRRAIAENGCTKRVRPSGPGRHSSSARVYGIASVTRCDLRAVRLAHGSPLSGPGMAPLLPRGPTGSRDNAPRSERRATGSGSPMIAGSTMTLLHPGAAAGNGAAQPCSEPLVGLRRAAFMRRPLARVSCILRFLPIPHIPYSCQAKSAGNKANFPPPLRGRVRVGGLQHSVAATRLNPRRPLPLPPPSRGGGIFCGNSRGSNSCRGSRLIR